MQVAIEKPIDVIINIYNSEECAICLEAHSVPIVLDCGHVFCDHCIRTVYISNPRRRVCPLCTQPLNDLCFKDLDDVSWADYITKATIVVNYTREPQRNPHTENVKTCFSFVWFSILMIFILFFIYILSKG